MGLVERQTPRQSVLKPGQQLVTTDQERDLNLIAGRVLIARDLGMRIAALAAVKQMPAKPSTDRFTRRQRRVVSVNVRAHASHQNRRLRQHRYVIRPATGTSRTWARSRSLTFNELRPHRRRPITPRAREHLDLELRRPAVIGHTRHRHPLDPQQTANVVTHPLFLLVCVFDNAKPQTGSGCLYPEPDPANSARPHLGPAQVGLLFTRRPHLRDSEWLIVSADGPCAEPAGGSCRRSPSSPTGVGALCLQATGPPSPRHHHDAAARLRGPGPCVIETTGVMVDERSSAGLTTVVAHTPIGRVPWRRPQNPPSSP
jgi:hypothetical protein